jgi:hypothetical protein
MRQEPTSHLLAIAKLILGMRPRDKEGALDDWSVETRKISKLSKEDETWDAESREPKSEK